MAVNPKNSGRAEPTEVRELMRGISLYRIFHREIAARYGCSRPHVTKVLTGAKRMTSRMGQTIRKLINQRRREILGSERRRA